MKPVIAVVGRPNVGKSTLFNRLTKSRDAIVADFAGPDARPPLRRRPRSASASSSSSTPAASSPTATTGIVSEMAKQTRQAVAEADVVIFVVDVRAGPVGAGPRHRALPAHASARRVLLAVNKAEGMSESPLLAEFHELGLGEPHPISAAHGAGHPQPDRGGARRASTLDEEDADGEPDEDAPIRLAVAGRPNVGKSTLINTWLGEERLVAFDQPGTTRDAISVPFERDGQQFELIDTAGLRRKGKVFEAIEKFSVVKTLQAIADANVVLLLLDATPGRHRPGRAHRRLHPRERPRAWWSRSTSGTRSTTTRSEHAASARSSSACAFLKFAPVLHISAHQAPGPRAGLEGDRRRPCLGRRARCRRRC